MMDDHSIAPINPLPPVVWLLVLPMIAVELALSLGELGVIGGAQAVGWRVAAMEGFGFFPDYWRQQAQAGAFDFELLRRFISFSFVHQAPVSAVFGVVLLLAVGKFVGEVFAGWAVALVFLASAAVGALVFGTFVQHQPLFGAFPGVYGMIGALSYLLRYGIGERPGRAFGLIGGLLAIQLLFGLVFTLLPYVFPSVGEMPLGWDWVADLSGFATGFLLSFLVAPGGYRRIRARLLQR
jgi:membrane associated rhomboid family serine protease